jgi:hypothetical protein
MSLPEIVSLEWGKIVVNVDGTNKTFKDCRIWAYDADQWDWGRTGTHHKPGTQFNDFADLLSKCTDTNVVILSTGVDNVLQVHPETIKKMRQHYPRVTLYILNTKEAVKTYNSLRKEHQIVALIHTTC